MRVNRMGKIAALTLALIFLSGCMPRVEMPKTEAALPQATLRDVPAAPEGFLPAERQALCQLWYPTDNGDRLTYEEAQISGGDEGELYASALAAMLAAGRGRFPAGASLAAVRCEGRNLAVVEWEAPRDVPERSLFALMAASVNTLSSLGVEAAIFRMNGRAAQAQGWPVGALLPSDGDLTGMWARLQLEASQNECARQAFVYRAARDEGGVAPELVELTLTRGGEVESLVEAMRRESGVPGAMAAFPSDASALRGAEWESAALRLSMDANLLAMLENEGIRAWQMYAATACTLLSFLPQAQGVEIYVGNARVGRMEAAGQQLNFESGSMKWDDFAPVRARWRAVYLPALDGRLAASPRFLKAAEGDNPLRLLSQVFSGPQAWEEALAPLAANLNVDEDVLGLEIAENEARVNLAASFRDKCAALGSTQERTLVYAMVNTLCQLRDVNQVRFYVEGEPAETFVSEISFLSPLKYNEGLARRAEP